MTDLDFFPRHFAGRLFKTYLRLPDHPAKVRIANIIGSAFFKKGILFTNKDRLLFRLEPNDWITRIFIRDGCYEKGSIRLAQTIMANGGVFFDIGANFGLFSCVLGKQPGTKIYSFEPNYDMVGNLLRNIRLNGLAQHATILNTAVSDGSNLVKFSVPDDKNKGTARYEADGSQANGNGVYVTTCSLAGAIDHLNIPYVTLIKIDIEGNEMDVFRNFDFTQVPVYNIIMEFNECTRMSLAELKSFFESRGYQVKNIDGGLVKEEKDIIENNLWLCKVLPS